MIRWLRNNRSLIRTPDHDNRVRTERHRNNLSAGTIRAGAITTGISWLTFVLAGTLALPVAAQTVIDRSENLDFDRPEAWAMAYMTAATLFSASGPARSTEPWSVSLGVEAGSIPRIPTEKRRVGFNGIKHEDLNKTPVFGRIRLSVGLPADFTFELGWTPPVTINGATPRGLFALALERPLFVGERWRSAVRVYHQQGSIRGDITCDRETASFEPVTPENPFGCLAPSDDRATLEYNGLELGAAWSLAEGRVEPFAAASVTRAKPRVRVNAELLEGTDRSLLTTRGTLYTGSLGMVYRPAPEWELVTAVTYTPLTVRRPPERTRDRDDFWSIRLTLRREI